jgi:peptidoglycan/LPS O-acetylase OafA/YrhL
MASRTTGQLLTTYDLMDGMRGLAAIAVMLSHARNILFLDATAELPSSWKIFYFMTGFGHEAVMIFFVLSGYWITKTVVRRSMEVGFNWPDYAIDRLSRLLIVLIPAITLGLIFDSVGRFGITTRLYLGEQGTNVLTWDVATRISLTNLVGNLLFLPSSIVEPLGSNAPLWSLANEFWYYVWFPPLYQLFRRQRPSIALGLLVPITMIAFRGLLPGFVCWLFGSLLFFGTQTPTVHTATQRTRFAGLAAVIALFIIALCLSRAHLDGRISDFAVSASFALFMFALIRSKRTYPRMLAPLCRYGAASSYSLYVVHFPLIVLLAALFFTPMHRLPPSCGLLLTFAGLGCVAIIYGYGVSAVTEANTSELRRWLKRKCLLRADAAA